MSDARLRTCSTRPGSGEAFALTAGSTKPRSIRKRVMASDGYAKGNPEFKGFCLSLAVKTEAEADRLFGALGDGGKVEMPLGKTFFSPKFGMVQDKFGVGWMVLVSPPA